MLARKAQEKRETEGRRRPLFRFKLPSEEFFRTAVVATAMTFGSICWAGNAGIRHDAGIKSKECTATISQIADYASRHPIKSTIFLLADVAAMAAFSIVYLGAIEERSRLGLND